MEIIGERGAQALCHGGDCIFLDDSEVDGLTALNPSKARGFFERTVRKRLSKKEKAILDGWLKGDAPFGQISGPAHISDKAKVKRIEDPHAEDS